MSALTQTLAEYGALRQLKHNDGSEGFVFAYDKAITDRYIAELRAALADEKAALAEACLRTEKFKKLADLASRQGVAVPAGWMLTPVAADKAMLDAAEAVDDLYRMGRPELWGRVFKAMCAAAPQPPAVKEAASAPTALSDSIADHAEFRQDLIRLSDPGLSRQQAKVIRNDIYRTIDARVKNAFLAAAGNSQGLDGAQP